jgi:hypothetical protein
LHDGEALIHRRRQKAVGVGDKRGQRITVTPFAVAK